jgi:hypothetical protein
MTLNAKLSRCFYSLIFYPKCFAAVLGYVQKTGIFLPRCSACVNSFGISSRNVSKIVIKIKILQSF